MQSYRDQQNSLKSDCMSPENGNYCLEVMAKKSILHNKLFDIQRPAHCDISL